MQANGLLISFFRSRTSCGRLAAGALRVGRCNVSPTRAVASFLVRSDYCVPYWRPTNSGPGILRMEVVTSAPTGTGRLLAVAAISPSNVWAVGAFTYSGGPALVEHWDGSSWEVTPTPADGLNQAELTGVAAIPGTDRAWAVGAVYGRPDGDADPLVELWTGSRWRLVSTPPLAHGGQLNGVVAFSSRDAWAVGASSPFPS
jgi:hypothetical protein